MNVFIAGVGGQGTLLASRVLGKYAVLKGMDVKLSEVHGMAQRGGSVVTYVKMGERVASPVIGEEEADVLLAFEKLEAARWAHCVKKGGVVLYSTQEIMPMPVIIGAAAYPSDACDALPNAFAVDALAEAEKLGNARVANTVMLGAFTRLSGMDEAVMREALLACIPPKTVELNLAAFGRGTEIAKESRA